LQSAFIIGKLVGKIDIRDFGSGNAGFTNTTRVLGAKTGVVVFLCDIIKLILAFLLCSFIFKGSGSFGLNGENGYLPGIYAGIGVVLGHNFPFYLQFRGGKGIACTLALMLCVNWKIALVIFLVGIIVIAFSKYISLASLIMSLAYPIFMIVLRHTFLFGVEDIVLMFVLCALAFYKHKANIGRLIAGNENKFTFSKQK
jgi:glycerol-3-phosphate acyltransferase PlsY